MSNKSAEELKIEELNAEFEKYKLSEECTIVATDGWNSWDESVLKIGYLAARKSAEKEIEELRKAMDLRFDQAMSNGAEVRHLKERLEKAEKVESYELIKKALEGGDDSSL